MYPSGSSYGIALVSSITFFSSCFSQASLMSEPHYPWYCSIYSFSELHHFTLTLPFMETVSKCQWFLFLAYFYCFILICLKKVVLWFCRFFLVHVLCNNYLSFAVQRRLLNNAMNAFTLNWYQSQKRLLLLSLHRWSWQILSYS